MPHDEGCAHDDVQDRVHVLGQRDEGRRLGRHVTSDASQDDARQSGAMRPSVGEQEDPERTRGVGLGHQYDRLRRSCTLTRADVLDHKGERRWAQYPGQGRNVISYGLRDLGLSGGGGCGQENKKKKGQASRSKVWASVHF